MSVSKVESGNSEDIVEQIIQDAVNSAEDDFLRRFKKKRLEVVGEDEIVDDLQEKVRKDVTTMLGILPSGTEIHEDFFGVCVAFKGCEETKLTQVDGLNLIKFLSYSG